jgi:hypothetical protein
LHFSRQPCDCDPHRLPEDHAQSGYLGNRQIHKNDAAPIA